MSIAQVYAEGRLIRGDWSSEEDGRQLLCLYTAMVGDAEARPINCPSHLCPKWLAYLLPWIDDSGTEKAWSSVVLRTAELATYFAHVRPRVEWQVRAACMREASRAMRLSSLRAKYGEIAAVCRQAVDLCDRHSRNEVAAAQESKNIVGKATELRRRLAMTTPWTRTETALMAMLTTAMYTMAPLSSAYLTAESAGSAVLATPALRPLTKAVARSADRLTRKILTLIEADLRDQGLL